tara:strand:+ start:199 stop:438 length:240 start_codon:yes stop_codon:yes gene_type:complete
MGCMNTTTTTICEEMSCTNEGTINVQDLWMLCPSCESLWRKPSVDRIINLPHPKIPHKRKTIKDPHAGEVFMFGPDAVS